MKRWRLICLTALFALCAAPLWSGAQGLNVGVSVQAAPPALPIYEQPPMPAAGYLWTPGYWAWGQEGYYWVPGTWVLAPAPGLLWTPGYWGWLGGAYLWHGGFWGPHVGFYGGINYGFGYGGVGYGGGFWRGGAFQYNREANNFGGVSVRNAYNQPLINNGGMNRVSFNGGNGGTLAVPTSSEQQAANEHHEGATPMQSQNEQAASGNRALLANFNHGAPAIAATPHPGTFSGAGVVRARAASIAGSGFQPPPRFQPREPSTRYPPAANRNEATMPAPAFNRAAPPRMQPPAFNRAAPPRMQPPAPYRAGAPRPQFREPGRQPRRAPVRRPAHPAASQSRAQRDERR